MKDDATRTGISGTAPAVLIRIDEDGDEERVPIGEELVIGRVSGDLVVPDDPFVSARHAAVRREGGGHVLHDLGSTNGTYAQIRGEIELRPGDHILVGGQVFRFVT